MALHLFLRMSCRIDRSKQFVNNSEEIRVSRKWWGVLEKFGKLEQIKKTKRIVFQQK